MNLAGDVRKLIKGDVADDEATRATYSHDASMFELRPQLVVFPKDSADVKALVKFVAAHKKKAPTLSLTPRSGGTDMTGGSITESIILSFTKYFTRITPRGGTRVTAEPGVMYRDFERETLKHNLLLPSYPASREICAIGGIVANNSGGEKTLAYGKTEKYVAELKVVLADGNEYVMHPLAAPELKKKIAGKTFEAQLYRKLFKLVDTNYDALQAARPRVSKNSAGYYLWNVWDRKTGVFDITKLFVGSQGTLGIMTEVTFDLIRPKPHSRLLVVFLRDLSVLGDLVNVLLRFKPESFESYDDKTLKLVFSYFRDFVRVLGVKNIFKVLWSFLPEARMVLVGGFPRIVLLVEFTGDAQEEVDRRAREAEQRARAFRVVTHFVSDATEVKEFWTIRHEAFNLLRSHLKKRRSIPFIDDLIVRPERLPEFLHALYALLKPYEKKMTIATGGHPGDGNIHVYSIMDIRDPSVVAVIPEIMEKTYDLVIRLGGSITAEHNDGLVRTAFLKKMYGEKIYKLFEETKKIFDPAGIFNPGKKTNPDLAYALAHIKRS